MTQSLRPTLDLTPDSRPKAAILFGVAKRIADQLADNGALSRRSLSAWMTEAFGCSDAAGTWSMRDAYDAMEIAQILHMRAGDTLGCQTGDPAGRFETLDQLVSRLPTQSYRSERQVDLQQFSTPIHIAYLASCAAKIEPGETVLEPSAGTGLLAHFARQSGALLLLNERDPLRADLLALAMGQAVTRHDGEQVDVLDVRPDVILINPPFSRSETRGHDRHAGARHLMPALRRLADGGRCVAIMSPAFAQDGSAAAGYRAVAALVAPRFEITIQGSPFAKHGTGIAVRILVYDKGWTGEPQRLVAAEARSAVGPILAVPGRLRTEPDPPVPPVSEQLARQHDKPRSGRQPLFAQLARPKLVRSPSTPTVAGTPEALAYEILTTPPASEGQVGHYIPWRLARLAFATQKPHPDQLVESVAMSSILPPAPSYRPMLPPRAVAALSDAQLETIIYAGQAFARDLPGRYLPNASGTMLSPNSAGHAYRQGYMVGDGTGVGKGQQIAGCIMDRWCRGQRRAVWISKSSALLEDARRDWSALGGLPIDVQPLDAFPFGSPIGMTSGILFLTFATLRSQRDDDQSRLHQILAWLGSDFDGVIAIDEAHELANAAGTETSHGTQKGSEQGLAGVRLQNLLPRACILLNSATGATDPANLCYASRLGLWGDGSAFESREAFMAAIGGGGIAAMEIVARDLKALGLYTARALTFEGVDYDPLEHKLTSSQIEIYDAYADAWAVIHRNLDDVLGATNIVDAVTNRSLNAQARGAALSRFESAKQRFFGQLLISMKLPTLIAAIEQDLAEDRHVIVQLVTTAEAMLDRQLAGLAADERAHLDIDLTPREYMIDYLRTAFPTRMMSVFKGSDGEMRSELMVDEAGAPVQSAAALEARDALIETLCAMPPIPSALDELIRHFGAEGVAEVTGRTRRLLTSADGHQRIERRTARSNIAEAEAFMSGQKALLIFSDAGGTGRSYHADRNCGSASRRRAHYLLEPGWRASSAIQGLGRSNRTNQQSAPIFRPVTTDCKGERRFISTIARRLDSLGALTRGQRQTGGQNLFDPADNLESDYAREALLQWYQLLYKGKLRSVTLDSFTEMTGLKIVDKQGGGLLETLPPIQRWLNRLLALRIGTQNAIFEEYLALIEGRVDAAREAGTLDLGVETIAAERIVTLNEQVLRRDPVSGAETKLSRLELSFRRRPISFKRLLDRWSGVAGVGFMRNDRSGRVALCVPSWPILDNEGQSIPVWQLIRPSGSDRMRGTVLAESHWGEVDEPAFKEAWESECAEIASRLDVETINIATGLLLPVWNKLPDDDVRVWRICDAAGQSLLGRIVSPSGFDKLAGAFGVTMDIILSPTELVEAARSRDGIAIPGLPGARLARVHVNDQARLEIRHFPAARREHLKALGCFTEIIAYKTRLFIPAAKAEAILAQLLTEAGPAGHSCAA